MRNHRSLNAPRRLLRSFAADTQAASAAEMALVLPIFAMVSLNLMDLCVYMYSRMQTELAAQAAVGVARAVCKTSTQLPATYPANHCSASLGTQMQAAAQATSLGTRVTLGAPTEAYYCADAAGNLRLVSAVNGTPPATCSGTVAGSTAAPGDYISVTASYAYSPFARGLTIVSKLSTPIQKTAWMRLQ